MTEFDTENGCWNCAQAEQGPGDVVWCAYWQAYFPTDHTGCEPPAFVPLVVEAENIIEIVDV
ncbi:MAG: hypothetical protein ACE5OZ_17095 [Candidatus Heimdallarchaeota archaeon]